MQHHKSSRTAGAAAHLCGACAGRRPRGAAEPTAAACRPCCPLWPCPAMRGMCRRIDQIFHHARQQQGTLQLLECATPQQPSACLGGPEIIIFAVLIQLPRSSARLVQLPACLASLASRGKAAGAVPAGAARHAAQLAAGHVAAAVAGVAQLQVLRIGCPAAHLPEEGIGSVRLADLRNSVHQQNVSYRPASGIHPQKLRTRQHTSSSAARSISMGPSQRRKARGGRTAAAPGALRGASGCRLESGRSSSSSEEDRSST